MKETQKTTAGHKKRTIATHSENGILISSGADPWIIRQGDNYYYCHVDSHDTSIYVRKAQTLKGLKNAKRIREWFPLIHKRYRKQSKQLWAPELHYLWGKWYIYFTADDENNENHRMYVLESETTDPQGRYHFKGQITSPDNHWAIDGTVLKMKDGKLYFMWSGCEDENINKQQNLYIAPMSNPFTIAGDRVCISRPTYRWEKGELPYVNEGPEILWHNEKLFIIYSASGSWTDDYCLGQLSYQGGSILSTHSWKKKSRPVFRKTRHIFGPGHASFVKSADGKEDWIIYHTAKYSHAGWNRQVRSKKFTWHRDNTPNFGHPI